MTKQNNIKDLELARGEEKKHKFKDKKDNTVKSLKEVECFLGNWKSALRGIKLFKILKR